MKFVHLKRPTRPTERSSWTIADAPGECTVHWTEQGMIACCGPVFCASWPTRAESIWRNFCEVRPPNKAPSARPDPAVEIRLPCKLIWSSEPGSGINLYPRCRARPISPAEPIEMGLARGQNRPASQRNLRSEDGSSGLSRVGWGGSRGRGHSGNLDVSIVSRLRQNTVQKREQRT